jgi:hypothetical protein
MLFKVNKLTFVKDWGDRRWLDIGGAIVGAVALTSIKISS